MATQTSGSAVLLLADGNIFYGNAFGKTGTTTGEICFNTGMTGYQEVFTDPSYYGQVVIMNSVHIGNYGVKPADDTTPRTVHDEWKWVDPEYVMTISKNVADIREIEIDASKRLADVNRVNNKITVP